MEIEIRKAAKEDYNVMSYLLKQTASIHNEGRPDVFKAGSQKFGQEEYEELLKNPKTPVFAVCRKDNKEVIGYAFCKITDVKEDNIRKERRYYFVEDLCVDKNLRGGGIGRQVMDFIYTQAKEHGCKSIELNVWECNERAVEFYKKAGFKTQKRQMEKSVEIQGE